MKVITLILFMLMSSKSFSQRLNSAPLSKPMEVRVISSDSVKVALDVYVDKSGKFISATYDKMGSTTNDEKMIAITKRKAGQIKYQALNESYTQRLIFNFTIAP